MPGRPSFQQPKEMFVGAVASRVGTEEDHHLYIVACRTDDLDDLRQLLLLVPGKMIERISHARLAEEVALCRSLAARK